MDKEFLFGVGITNANQEDILKYILYSLKKKDKKYYVVTPNPEILVYANKNPHFKTILNNARLALCDGAGLLVAAKILGKSLKTRTTGVDLMESLCKEIAKKPITVGFLGGRHQVAEKAAECLRKKYPGLTITFVAEEWNEDGFVQAQKGQGKKEIDLLFVAYGFPKQEEWMSKHLDALPIRVAMGVGGAFDYISGNVSRAPESIRKIGLEWLFRLIMQPWRIRRQVALPVFIWLVIKEKIANML